MWLPVPKLLMFIYLTTFTSVAAYDGILRHKTNYVNSKWRERLKEFSEKKSNSAVVTEKPHEETTVKVRHSHHPNLERVLNRLSSAHGKTTKRPLVYGAPRYTTTTTSTEASIQDNEDDEVIYEDEDFDENVDRDDEDDSSDVDYDGWMNDAGDDDYEEDDPALEEDYEEDDVGDLPAVTSTTASTLSAFGEYKWRHYGTRTGVEESRNKQFMPSNGHSSVDIIRKVIAHTVRMNNEGRCGKPTPKVIPVQHEHPNPSKNYIPHCTILHRCGEDSGCCSNYATRCTVKKYDIVELYFYTNTLGVQGSKVESLPFYNHTECACMEISKISDLTNNTVESLRVQKSGISVRSTNHVVYPAPESIRRCKCPLHYIPGFNRAGANCHCYCSDSNHVCQRLNKGKEHFGIVDRRCISSKECTMPSCEYGMYINDVGRCPRKHEKRQLQRY